jgi:hypothetical protein
MSYTIVLCIPAKFYCSSVSVNGTSRSILFNGGSASILVTNATIVMQSITVAFLNSSTPTVFSSVTPMY